MPTNSKTSDQTIYPSHCVMIPFLDRHDQVAACMDVLLQQALPNTLFLLIDDGSMPEAIHSPDLKTVLSRKNVYLIHHRDNLGVSAARNSGLHWCRQHRVDIVIMIDSDCRPNPDVIIQHLELHGKHPQAVCIGAQIIGVGKNTWSTLDGITSWVHASPHNKNIPEFRPVRQPFHLATTNFSAKLSLLPKRDFVFDERLMTGEDCLLIREIRRDSGDKNGGGVYFSSSPVVYHQDRETLSAVFKHQYQWGHHQYFIQLGGDVSDRCFNPLYRGFFVLVFLPVLPLFALAGSLLNSKIIFSAKPRLLYLYPLIYLLWFGKAIAVLEAALNPSACLRKARDRIAYEAL